MTTILSILVVLFAIGALAALVRGVIVFIRTTDAELRSNTVGPSQSSLKQNKMMWRRIQFQALAVIGAVLLLMLAHPHA
ncbi:hypothetical protein [Sphingomonas sp.]|uniref:hypothetical protein n=1 Tax=Sphingomonas sp. TaxID=28214 RepID=UPI003B008E55